MLYPLIGDKEAGSWVTLANPLSAEGERVTINIHAVSHVTVHPSHPAGRPDAGANEPDYMIHLLAGESFIAFRREVEAIIGGPIPPVLKITEDAPAPTHRPAPKNEITRRTVGLDEDDIPF